MIAHAAAAAADATYAAAAAAAAAATYAAAGAATTAANATYAAAGAATTAAAVDAAVDATYAAYGATDATTAAADATYAAADEAPVSEHRIWRVWVEITADVGALEAGLSAQALTNRPLWNHGIPEQFVRDWNQLKGYLLSLDENWQVWTNWYDDRLRGADDPESRPLIEALEVERVLIPAEDWEKGPKHVNAIIAALELKHRAKAPEQRAAIIEVEYGDDGRLHRRRTSAPVARNEAQDQRLRAAWSAHSDQLAALERLDPGRNAPALDFALNDYRAALGSCYDDMNVIALGVHGTRIAAHAARADERLLEEAAGELVGLAASHELFIRQFDTWLQYVDDASPEPTDDSLTNARDAAHAMRDHPEIIGEDVAETASALADAAAPILAADSADRPPPIVQRELVRSIGNVLSGMLAPLVNYVGDAGPAARKGSISGIEELAKKATLAVGYAGSAYVLALAAGMPSEFGWIIPVLTYIKLKLEK